MAEIFLALFVIFLSIVGISYLIMSLAISLLSDKNQKFCLTLFLQGENADIKLITFLEGLKWQRKKKNCAVLAVDCGIDPDCKKECEKIALDSGCITYLALEDYEKHVKEFIERKG